MSEDQTAQRKKKKKLRSDQERKEKSYSIGKIGQEICKVGWREKKKKNLNLHKMLCKLFF